MIKGVEHLYKGNETKGLASIVKFNISDNDAKTYNMQMLFNGCGGLMSVDPGQYVKLYVGNMLMMSDTRMEKMSNSEFLENAKGDVMIAGLGIGLIIDNLRDKIVSKEVTSITVYEKYKDVIDLVGPKFKDLPIRIIEEDILEYRPPKDEKYDTMYFDIWPTIDYEKNLPEIRLLHNRWKFHKKTKDSWMNSWMKELMQQHKREDNRW